jgi:hypothetical protein
VNEKIASLAMVCELATAQSLLSSTRLAINLIKRRNKMDNIKFDEDRVPVEVNGKKLMKSYQNAYRKASNTDYFTSFDNRDGLVIRGNLLTSFESSIYKWVMDWQIRYEYAINNGIFPITKITQAPIQTFDNMRYLFSAINQDLYMNILD